MHTLKIYFISFNTQQFNGKRVRFSTDIFLLSILLYNFEDITKKYEYSMEFCGKYNYGCAENFIIFLRLP